MSACTKKYTALDLHLQLQERMRLGDGRAAASRHPMHSSGVLICIQRASNQLLAGLSAFYSP
jgi:hypothetical protein